MGTVHTQHALLLMQSLEQMAAETMGKFRNDQSFHDLSQLLREFASCLPEREALCGVCIVENAREDERHQAIKLAFRVYAERILCRFQGQAKHLWWM